MKLLIASDVHAGIPACRTLAKRASEVDVVVIAGDFARQHTLLGETIAELGAITTPSVVVPGNNETLDALQAACARDWPAATVLHGSGCTIDGTDFWGLGAGVPVTPFGSWSFDLTEDAAAALLEGCPEGAVLVTHSPPRGLADVTSGGEHVGSTAVLECIRAKSPPLVVCGHVHDSWETEIEHDDTRVINVGPRGRIVEI